MKKEVKGLIAGVLIGTTLTSGMVFAKQARESIEAIYRDIKIYVDGVKIDPKDANGAAVEPFIYNGTTYLPVRAVGEAINKQVSWDGETNSVYLGEKPGSKQYLIDVAPPYGGAAYRTYSSSKGEFLSMGGKKYTNGIMLGYYSGFALFNLDGNFKNITFTAGRPDDQNIMDTTLNFYVDDTLIKSIDIKGDALPKTYTVPVNYGLQLKIATECEDVALMDMFLN